MLMLRLKSNTATHSQIGKAVAAHFILLWLLLGFAQPFLLLLRLNQSHPGLHRRFLLNVGRLQAQVVLQDAAAGEHAAHRVLLPGRRGFLLGLIIPTRLVLNRWCLRFLGRQALQDGPAEVGTAPVKLGFQREAEAGRARRVDKDQHPLGRLLL